MNDTYSWIKVADSITDIPFNDNHIAEVVASDKTICIARHKDILFAFAQKCPHASGLLVNGHMDALSNIVCPVHRYKFCLKNGHNISGEGYYLKHWPVTIREEGIYVGLEKNPLMELL